MYHVNWIHLISKQCNLTMVSCRSRRYIVAALEFHQWAFQTPKERAAAAARHLHRQHVIQTQLCETARIVGTPYQELNRDRLPVDKSSIARPINDRMTTTTTPTMMMKPCMSSLDTVEQILAQTQAQIATVKQALVANEQVLYGRP